MSTTAVAEKTTETLVGMGQVEMMHRPEVAGAVIGSCIALSLFHPRLGVGALGHIVLPEAAGRTGPPCKFANTAVPYMVEMLNKEGANTAGLVAKMVGGANMFGKAGPMQVGEGNAEAVSAALKELRIPIAAQDVGGARGRRITFDTATGDLIVRYVGDSVIHL